MSILFTNNAESTLNAAIGAADITLTLPAGAGALFPSPAAPDVAYVTLGRGVGSEVVQLTARSGDTLTVIRGQDGTTAQAWAAGTVIALRLPAVVAGQFAQKAQLATVATTGKSADLVDYVDPVGISIVFGS